MNKSALTQAMKASISEVLEQMFFMSIDFADPANRDADTEPDATSIIAKLDFHGYPSGTFVLLIPASLARSVSADFLGATAHSLATQQVEATVLEMVNMLAGNTLSRNDRQALFDLQIPELIGFNDLRALNEAVSDQIVIQILTPENRLTFQLIMHQAENHHVNG